MLAEFGLFSLILALFFACSLALIPTYGLFRAKQTYQSSAPYYVLGQFLFVLLAYTFLTLCFLNNDFSVNYVASNSSIALPWFYKLCAVWGGHEGSMLLWVFILSFWMLAVSFCSKGMDSHFRTKVLVILGWLSIGLFLFLLMTSNPFTRQFSMQLQGRDLNPLLQDPGFLFHPPMLYMGYVGFSVSFAFAIAALWSGKLESTWAKWARPWTLAAWCCLTAGITLGSWWAYRELGWGGWWFWDPVENASFMPWLAGTALLHSLAVSEQREQFRAWTVLLAITVFSLSLIGTFLVRSGVLTSVHAFAVDPQRGFFILGFLLLVIGGSLLLFGLRAKTLKTRSPHAFISKESALLLNNLLLIVIMLSILLGTVYPLLIDGLGLGKLSVGAPYFNSIFVPLMLLLLFIMGIGIHINWKKDSFTDIAKRLLIPALMALILSLLLLVLLSEHLYINACLGLTLAFWIILSTLKLVIARLKQRGLLGLRQAFWGMVLAHIGVAVTVIGIVVSNSYGIQDDVRMAPGDKTVVAGYSIAFIKEQKLKGPNYQSTQAQFEITKAKKELSSQKSHIIYPEKRIYDVGQMALTESAIDVNLFRDLYIALGEPLGEKAWSVRIYYKPFVRWIWGGGFFILLGGLLALGDRRYYQRRS
jgi:cytochrome c-type biogenesis protein CcmF